MSKTKKIVLGIATIWPIIYMVIFFLFIFSQIFLSPSSQSDPSGGFFLIFILHFLTMIWMFVLLFIYIRDVFKNDRVAKDKKALWAVVLFFGNIIAMLIYWYLYIWKEPKDRHLQE